MLKLILFLAFQASARLVKFRFPDPANETAPFCDLLPLIKSNAFIRCTNSSFHGSSCAFRCQGEDRLLNQYGIEANKYSTCFCDEKDSCTWRGDASDAKCQDAGKLREEIVSSVNRGFVKTYLKEELTPIMLKVSKSTGGNIRRVIKKSKKLRKQVLKQIPTSDNGLAEFFGQKDKLQMIQDVPIDVEELERNIKADSSGGCKPLTLSFGSVECSNGFAENSECKNVCKEGYVLHRKSPGKRVCICTKWGCTWLKKTPARCQRRTKRGRNKGGVNLPSCVHIANGVKVLVRSNRCVCPSGWRNSDRCASPNDDWTAPCRFSHPASLVKYREEDFGNVKVKLDCSNTRISMPLLEDGKEGSFEGPFEKMIVPGHTTQVDFHRSGLTILKRELLEGAFRLQTADFSENFLKNLPFDLFVKNQIISEINLSKNQIRSVPPRLFLGLNQLKSINLSHNQIGSLNKLLFKDANSVTHLDLSNNRLLSITRVTLMNMINLQSLDLSSNRFRDLSALKFDGKQLESIKLGHNNLDKLSMTMFKHLDNVKTFSARGNRLDSIPSFISNKLVSAISIDFAENRITELKEGQFKNATRLKRLFMEDNFVKVLPESGFGECETLVFIDFRRNKFKRFKNDWLKNCKNLTHVFFGQNDIQDVPKALFNPQANLRTFDLSNNRIKKLPVEFAEQNQDLAHIFLQNNLIKRLPTHLFYGSERLKSIDLANNRLLTVGNVLPRDLNIRPDHVNLINLSRNKNVGEELNKRWAGYDSWHYKSGAIREPVDDPMTAFENALKESSHHLRSLNPTGGLVERFGFTPFEDDQEEGGLGLRRALDNLSGTSFSASLHEEITKDNEL